MNLILKENRAISLDLRKLLNEHHVESGHEVLLDAQKDFFSYAFYDDEELVGGLVAEVKLGQFYIELLAVSKKHRSRQLGKRLMLIAEQKAKQLNCHHILVNTYSYQAPDFYLKVGFKELSRIVDFPLQGVDKLSFIKYLDTSAET